MVPPTVPLGLVGERPGASLDRWKAENQGPRAPPAQGMELFGPVQPQRLVPGWMPRARVLLWQGVGDPWAVPKHSVAVALSSSSRPLPPLS